jgi:hypothetical protein
LYSNVGAANIAVPGTWVATSLDAVSFISIMMDRRHIGLELSGKGQPDGVEKCYRYSSWVGLLLVRAVSGVGLFKQADDIALGIGEHREAIAPDRLR